MSATFRSGTRRPLQQPVKSVQKLKTLGTLFESIDETLWSTSRDFVIRR
jgi:hypothetical protein